MTRPGVTPDSTKPPTMPVVQEVAEDVVAMTPEKKAQYIQAEVWDKIVR